MANVLVLYCGADGHIGTLAQAVVEGATRDGMRAASRKHFLDQTGALWFDGALIGKLAGIFTWANTQPLVRGRALQSK